MLVLHVLAICLVASGKLYKVDVPSSVKITTIPSQGPFRVGQKVQFSCEIEPQSDHVIYQWKTVENVKNGGYIYSIKSFNKTYDTDNILRYCWYYCSAILNGTVLGSTDKLVEVHGLLQTDEQITRAFSLHERMVMRIYISDYKSRAQNISSLAWYHNGTELTSDDRVSITNNGTTLTISNMIGSDAGKYEVKINSLRSDPAICDMLNLPVLLNYALHAPVTFLLQESHLPSYNAEEVILDYARPAYQGTDDQSFAINITVMVNATALLNKIRYNLYKDGIYVSYRNTYNIAVSYDNVTTTQSVRITYTNTDEITGHYVHMETSIYNINRETCPLYYEYIKDIFSDIIPIFTFYWNIRSYGDTERGAIKRGANPPRFHTNGCPSEKDNEDILMDVLQLLSTEFGVVPLGLAKSYAAVSCQEVANASAQNKAGLYWITDGTNTHQKFCNF